MEVGGQLHTPAALPSGKEPLVPIGLGGPQRCSGRGGEEYHGKFLMSISCEHKHNFNCWCSLCVLLWSLIYFNAT